MYPRICAWSIENNNVDLSGLLIPFDVGVFRTDQSNGSLQPLPNTQVEITSSFGGVYLIPQQAVEVVSYPGLPGGITSQEDVKAACTDANGNYSMNEDWCAWYWDTESQTFISLLELMPMLMNMIQQMAFTGLPQLIWLQKLIIEAWFEHIC